MSRPIPNLVPHAVGLAFALLFALPVLTAPTQMALGEACGMAGNDLWSMWASVDGAQWEAGQLGFPAAASSPDGFAPAVWLLGHALMPVLGNPIAVWNTIILMGFIALVLGTIALGRRVSPDAPNVAQLTLVLAVVGATAWSPLLRQLGAGVMPLMLVPATLALVHAWVQPQSSWITGVAAAAMFTLSSLGHWGGSVLVLLMVPPMVVVIAQHLEGRQAWRRAFGALFPGLVIGMLHIVSSHHHLPGLPIEAGDIGPAWIHQVGSALVLPATAAVALPSLGMLLLALAGVSARPRSTAGWLLTATWGILLAAGTVGGTPSRILPVNHLVDNIPLLENLYGWWAVAPLVAIPLGIAAMRGVEALHRARRDALAWAVLGLSLVDQAIPAAMVTSPQRIAPRPSAAVQTALSSLPAGGVLQLPIETEDCTLKGKHRLWQRFHQRPVSTAGLDGKDGGLQVSYIARISKDLANNPPPRASADSPLNPRVFMCAQADIATLIDLGFAAVSLDLQAGAHPALSESLEMVLGPPMLQDDEAMVWALADVAHADTLQPCPLPIIQ
jgi:hypothetical protein